MWNGINYLLKIPTDLDYIDDYKAITNWLGFSIRRNPFCVPYPMEDGQHLFAGSFMEPTKQEGLAGVNTSSDGFTIGGGSSKVRQKLPKQQKNMSYEDSAFFSPKRDGSDFNKPVPSPYKSSGVGPAEFSETIQVGHMKTQNGPMGTGTVQSFILNDEMTHVRNCEHVMLVEEDKYGRLDRDPQGRILPEEHSLMKHLADNLDKDGRRDMSEQTVSDPRFAPHAKLSVGYADAPFYPGENDEEDEDDVGMKEEDSKDLDSLIDEDSKGGSKSNHITRDKHRTGGKVQLMTPAGGSSRPRKPQFTNTANQIEFLNSRKKKTSGDRMKEITYLKEKIAREKALLAEEARNGYSEESKVVETPKKKKRSKKPPVQTELSQESISSQLEAMKEDPEMVELNKEEEIAQEQYQLAEAEGKNIQDLKQIHRIVEVKERSREIERKRRKLTHEEAKRRGPPDDDLCNAYDYYATKAQAIIRGWLAKNYVRWYRIESYVCSKTIQTRVRGMISRIRVARMKHNNRAATLIQKQFRGMYARIKSAALARDFKLGRAAVQIQKVWRRIMSLQRVQTKRDMDVAAKLAMEFVDARNLFQMDIKELAIRIQNSINEPRNNPFPPDEVLHLLRMVSILLVHGEGFAGLTTYNNMGARYHEETDGRNISWEQAGKLANRSNKYLRRIRALAFAPLAKPPRLVALPEDVVALYKAQNRNPKWCVETFETMGKGSKACTQLFRWLDSMIVVGTCQTKFFNFIGDKFPDWLPKLFDIQKKARKCEFEICLQQRAINVIQQLMDTSIGEDNLLLTLAEEKHQLQRERDGTSEKLKRFEKSEKMLGEDQSTLEDMTFRTMLDRVEQKEASLRELADEYSQLISDTELGSTVAEGKLAGARERLITAQLEVKEFKIQEGMLKAQIDNNRQRRRKRKPLSAEVIIRANLAGEGKALLIISTVKKKVLLLDRGIRSEDGLHRHPDAVPIYNDLTYVENQRKEEFRLLLKSADDELEDLHYRVTSAILQAEESEKRERAAFIPTEAELEEERLEDEKEAQEERFAKQMFVAHKVLFDAPTRKRPVIIAFSRDVPGFTKEKIISEITSHIPGLFVRLDEDHNMGIDVHAMQEVFDAKKCIIMSVDHGLTATTRTNFVKNFDFISRCLVPQPYSIFVTGEDGNMRHPTGDPKFGVNRRDMSLLRDADIKLSLEKMAYIRQALLTEDIRRRMELRANMILPPSPAYIVVLEAMYIAQADHTRFQQPDKNISAISFRATQAILQDAYYLKERLEKMKRGKADFKLCDILKNYVSHYSWPTTAHPERKSDPLLSLLATYVEEWTNSEILTLERGGVPDASLFKNSMKRVQCVVALSDVQDSEDNLEAKKRSGWKLPITQILKGALFEMKVMKTVRRIDGTMYSINVYREAGRVFFDAYDSLTSQSYVTSLSIFDIPNLLVPNALTSDKDKNDPRNIPPDTSKEMYRRLIALLRFQKATKLKAGRKELLCRRDNKFISHSTTIISGHPLFIKCFEAALGEIYFEAYLPEYSAKLTLQVDDSIRLRMLKNCDAALEHHMMETEYSVDLLPYVVDRLRVQPSRPSAHTRKFIPTGLTALSKTNINQGFKLVVNCVQGPGRFLSRKIISFAGIIHILTFKSSSVTHTLRIQAYEPRTKKTLELRLSKFERILLLGIVSENMKLWYPKLLKKLKMNFKGKRQLVIDRTVYKTVLRISRRRLIFSIVLIDEKMVKIDFFDPFLSEHFSAKVKKTDIIDIIHYNESNSKGAVAGVVSAVKDILRFMLGARRKAGGGARGIDPSEYDLPLVDILSNEQLLAHLKSQFEILLERINPTNIRAGYLIRVPVQIKFLLQKEILNTNNDENFLDTKLRRTVRLNKKERGASLMDVLCRRTQGPVIHMETELDTLAYNNARAAEEKAKNDKEAAKKLHQQLTELAMQKERELEEKERWEAERLERQEKERLEMLALQEQEKDAGEQQSIQTSVQPHSLQPAGSTVGDMSEGSQQLVGESSVVSDSMTVDPGNVIDTKKKQEDTSSEKDDTEGNIEKYDQDMEVEDKVSPSTETEGVKKGEGAFDDEQSEVKVNEETTPDLEDHEDDDEETRLYKQEQRRRLEEDKKIVNFDVDEEEKQEHPDEFAKLDDVLTAATVGVVDNITNTLEEKNNIRLKERKSPGMLQAMFLERKQKLAELEAAVKVGTMTEEEVQHQVEIIGEICVFDRGVKSNFREGKAKWHGHVSVKCYESACWDAAHGVGRRLRFVVYEPKSTGYYEGVIRTTHHLKEVLGLHGQDLVDPAKTTEMLLFVCRRRLEVVRNNTTWDGSPVTDVDAPFYRIEFICDRLFDPSKITPAHIGGEQDAKANKNKLIANASSRGRKIVRVARRVSGLLLQLVVFELPKGESGFDDEQEVAQEDEREALKAKSAKLEANLFKKADVRSLQKKRSGLEVLVAPPLRVVGYDPRSKKRHILLVPPEAVTEIAGGGYSHYLKEERRRELGRVVCESLQLSFPRGGGFELVLPWSGLHSNKIVGTGGAKMSWRSNADRVLQRSGKLFRAGIRMFQYDIIVSVYATLLSDGSANERDKTIIINFYAAVASEASEISLNEEKQKEYMGRALLDFLPGDTRGVAIRNLCKYFRPEISEDPSDSTKKILNVELLPKKKGYISDYKEVGLPPPEADLRASGVPVVHMPPDTTGDLMYRSTRKIFRKELDDMTKEEYMMSVYTKQKGCGPERGIVVKVYDSEICQTIVLHYGPMEVLRLCEEGDQPDLMRDIVTAREQVTDGPKDSLEEGFVSLTEKGETLKTIKHLSDIFCQFVMNDVGMMDSSQGDRVLYSLTSSHEPK